MSKDFKPEKQNFDLECHDTSHPEVSPLKTLFNICKTMVGAGIFGTAYALSSSGFVFGVVLILILAAIFYWTIVTYVKASVLTETKDAQSLLKHCFGTIGVAVLNTAFILNAWVIIGEVFPAVFNIVMGAPQTPFMVFFLSREGQLILVSICVLLPISMAKSLHGLSYFSAMALAAILFIIGAMLAIGPTLPKEFKGADAPLTIIHPSGITGAIGVLSFAYVCHQNLLLNYHQMKTTPNKLATFSRVAQCTMLLAVTMTFAVGCTWFTFKEKSQANILASFPQDHTIIVICRILFGIDMCFTYPLELYVVRDTIEQCFWRGKPFSHLRHTIMTVLIVASTLGISLLTSNLGYVVELTGGVAAAAIAFIFPGACWLRANQLKGIELSRTERYSHLLCVVFGFIVMIFTVVATIMGAVKGSH